MDESGAGPTLIKAPAMPSDGVGDLRHVENGRSRCMAEDFQNPVFLFLLRLAPRFEVVWFRPEVDGGEFCHFCPIFRMEKPPEIGVCFRGNGGGHQQGLEDPSMGAGGAKVAPQRGERLELRSERGPPLGYEMSFVDDECSQKSLRRSFRDVFPKGAHEALWRNEKQALLPGANPLANGTADSGIKTGTPCINGRRGRVFFRVFFSLHHLV